VGLIFGINGVIKKKKFGMAALICSIIGLVLSIINAALGVYFAVSKIA
jgi:disulfide bond formation protein DsbB